MLAATLSLATASALALVSSVSAAPTERDIPTLSCKTVITDNLTLVKGDKSYNVSFIADYHQNDAIKQYGETVPKGDTENPNVLTSFSKTNAAKFAFKACTSSSKNKKGSFVKAPAHETAEGLNIYNGHLVSVSSGKCVALDPVYSDLNFLSAIKCSSLDDSSQHNQYWQAIEQKEGGYKIVYTYSHDYSEPHTELKFAPGTGSKKAALYAKGGSIAGGAWTLTL